MDLPRNYISYNQIRQYQICPQKYYYSYIKELSSPINDKILLGVVFHSAIEFYLKNQIAGSTPSNESLIDFFSERFDKSQKDTEINWLESAAKTKNRGLSFIKYFLREIAGSIKPLMVEKELETEIEEIGVKLKGIIDLVEQDFSITDFKTTTAKWSKDRIKKSYLQMHIYKYLFEKSLGNVISDLKFKIIYSKNSANIKHQEVLMKAMDVDQSKMFAIIKYVAENISRGVFYRNESFACNYCEFRKHCLGR